MPQTDPLSGCRSWQQPRARANSAVLSFLCVAAATCCCATASDLRTRKLVQSAAADQYASARLSARPRTQAGPTGGLPIQPGTSGPIGVSASGRDGWLYVPVTYDPLGASPFIMLLHGAGGNGRDILRIYNQEVLNDRHIIVFCPDSRDPISWDMILMGKFGPDVQYIDQALSKIFQSYSINTNHTAAAGFSDGASYALSTGLANGDNVFTHIMAYAPGYMRPPVVYGKPKIYISHGVNDPVLPIDRASRRIVPALQKFGYEVVYKEFEGGHEIPSQYAMESLDWFLQPIGGAANANTTSDETVTTTESASGP